MDLGESGRVWEPKEQRPPHALRCGLCPPAAGRGERPGPYACAAHLPFAFIAYIPGLALPAPATLNPAALTGRITLYANPDISLQQIAAHSVERNTHSTHPAPPVSFGSRSPTLHNGRHAAPGRQAHRRLSRLPGEGRLVQLAGAGRAGPATPAACDRPTQTTRGEGRSDSLPRATRTAADAAPLRARAGRRPPAVAAQRAQAGGSVHHDDGRQGDAGQGGRGRGAGARRVPFLAVPPPNTATHQRPPH